MIVKFDARLIHALNVSCSEFMLLVLISMPQKQDSDGYYFMPRSNLAFDLNITREATIKMINRLEALNLVRRHETNGYIKINLQEVNSYIERYNSTRHKSSHLSYYGK